MTKSRLVLCVVILFGVGVFRALDREAPLGEDAWGREALLSKKSIPRDFLQKSSFDVLAIYQYGKHCEQGVALEWAQSCMEACERARIGDLAGRVETIDGILDAVKAGAATPVDDPAYLAALLLYAPQVPTKAPLTTGSMTPQDLLVKGVSPAMVESLVLEYCRLRPDIYVSVLLPRGAHQYESIVDSFESVGELIYDKAVYLHSRGPLNYVRHAYDFLCRTPHHWVLDKTVAAEQAAKRFSSPKPMHLLVFQARDWRDVRPWKLRVRDMPGMGTRAIHATDSYQESLDLAQVYLNDNTIHYINYAHEVTNKDLELAVEALKKRAGADLGNYCLDGSCVIGAYGLGGEVGDFSVYHLTGVPSTEGSKKVADVMHNPERHFTYRGVKCVTLPNLHLVAEGDSSLICEQLLD